MFFLRFNNISRLSYFLALILVLPLVACSGGDGGDGGLGSSAPTLSWVAPSEREDDTALSLSEIGSYRIYYGVETGNYQVRIEINDPTATQAQVTEIPPGTYFAVVTTVDSEGRESIWSAPELRVSF